MPQDFGKMGPVSYVLEWIKNSPNLNELEISVRSTSDNPEVVLKYLDTILLETTNRLSQVCGHQ